MHLKFCMKIYHELPYKLYVKLSLHDANYQPDEYLIFYRTNLAISDIIPTEIMLRYVPLYRIVNEFIVLFSLNVYIEVFAGLK
jgi:hypothetical protein